MRPIPHCPISLAVLAAGTMLLAANAQAQTRRCDFSSDGRTLKLNCATRPVIDRSTSTSPDQRFWRLVRGEGSCAVYAHRQTGQRRTFCDE